MKTIDEHGRKFFTVMAAMVFFLIVDIALVARVWVGSALDTDTMLQVAIGAAGVAGVYVGANAWHKQAEARVEVKQIEAQSELDAQSEI